MLILRWCRTSSKKNSVNMFKENLQHKKCVPCEGGVDPLSSEEVNQYLSAVEGWKLVDEKIVRTFTFKDFSQALTFVNAVGALAEDEGHHPNINLHSWNKVELTLYTHAINGLHLNDFVVASKINQLDSK